MLEVVEKQLREYHSPPVKLATSPQENKSSKKLCIKSTSFEDTNTKKGCGNVFKHGEDGEQVCCGTIELCPKCEVVKAKGFVYDKKFNKTIKKLLKEAKKDEN